VSQGNEVNVGDAASAATPQRGQRDQAVQGRIDLHTHSTASDGVYAPAELVRLAAVERLTCIALTDHDSTVGVDEAQVAGGEAGVEVIGGIELNTDLPGKHGEAHVLGYFVAREQADFQATLSVLREARERRGEHMVERLRAAGLDITWERVRELAHGAVGRPHVAQALIEAGYAENIADAFDRYLMPGTVGYISRYKLSPEDAIRLIRSAYGVPVLAHPAAIPGLEHHVLPSLVAAGLLGLECYYGEYNDATVTRLLALAHVYGLMATGGSDYHGPNIHPTPLGARYVPPAAAEELRATAVHLRAEPPVRFALPQSSGAG
jgi:predicted metal-dependent phosphoesterase TrpH